MIFEATATTGPGQYIRFSNVYAGRYIEHGFYETAETQLVLHEINELSFTNLSALTDFLSVSIPSDIETMTPNSTQGGIFPHARKPILKSPLFVEEPLGYRLLRR